MNIWEKSAYLLATKDVRPGILSQSEILTNPKRDLQARGHYELARIFRAEAQRLPFFSPIYRSRATYHINEGAAKAQFLPGPLGLKAVDEISEGNFEDGIKDLEEEIERLIEWMKYPEVASEYDLVTIFEYFKLGGSALGQIGRFTESREWFENSPAVFDKLRPESRAQLAESSDEIVLGISWSLQLEMKFDEALEVITKRLADFSFSTYPTEKHDLLKSGQAVLIEFLPLVSDFKESVETGPLLRELIEKIQRCETSEATRKTRKLITKELEGKSYRLPIDNNAEAAIVHLNKQIETIRQLLNRPAPKPTGSQRFDSLNVTMKEVTDRLFTASIRIIEGSIAEVQKNSLITTGWSRLPQSKWLSARTVSRYLSLC
jgi:hypothetical protein